MGGGKNEKRAEHQLCVCVSVCVSKCLYGIASIDWYVVIPIMLFIHSDVQGHLGVHLITVFSQPSGHMHDHIHGHVSVTLCHSTDLICARHMCFNRKQICVLSCSKTISSQV